GVDPVFRHKMKDILGSEDRLTREPRPFSDDMLREMKQIGFSDHRLAELLRTSEPEFRRHRQSRNILPTFKRVDTCGAEFQALTPYLYSTSESECESRPTDRQKVMILGGGDPAWQGNRVQSL